MAERLKAHAWKACLGETLTWVRIPLSPPAKSKTYACHQVRQRAAHFSLAQFSPGIGTYRTSPRIMKASSGPISQRRYYFAPVRCVSRIDPRAGAPHKLLQPHYISRSFGLTERHSRSGQLGLATKRGEALSWSRFQVNQSVEGAQRRMKR